MEWYCDVAPDAPCVMGRSWHFNTQNAVLVPALFHLTKLRKSKQVLANARVNERVSILQGRHDHIESRRSRAYQHVIELRDDRLCRVSKEAWKTTFRCAATAHRGLLGVSASFDSRIVAFPCPMGFLKTILVFGDFHQLVDAEPDLLNPR